MKNLGFNFGCKCGWIQNTKLCYQESLSLLFLDSLSPLTSQEDSLQVDPSLLPSLIATPGQKENFWFF